MRGTRWRRRWLGFAFRGFPLWRCRKTGRPTVATFDAAIGVVPAATSRHLAAPDVVGIGSLVVWDKGKPRWQVRLLVPGGIEGDAARWAAAVPTVARATVGALVCRGWVGASLARGRPGPGTAVAAGSRVGIAAGLLSVAGRRLLDTGECTTRDPLLVAEVGGHLDEVGGHLWSRHVGRRLWQCMQGSSTDGTQQSWQDGRANERQSSNSSDGSYTLKA